MLRNLNRGKEAIMTRNIKGKETNIPLTLAACRAENICPICKNTKLKPHQAICDKCAKL